MMIIALIWKGFMDARHLPYIPQMDPCPKCLEILQYWTKDLLILNSEPARRRAAQPPTAARAPPHRAEGLSEGIGQPGTCPYRKQPATSIKAFYSTHFLERKNGHA